MRRKVLSFICLFTFSTALFAEDCAPDCKRYCCRGQSSSYGSSYSVGTSMLTWGVIFFVGFGLIAAFYHSNSSGSSSDSSN